MLKPVLRDVLDWVGLVHQAVRSDLSSTCHLPTEGSEVRLKKALKVY